MADQSPPVLTDTLRRLLAGITEPSGRLLHRLGVHPDTLTVVGCVLVGVACVPIAQGQFALGGLLLLLSLPFDTLDGAVARARGHASPFGAVLDSTLDRYADGFIFVAFSYYFAVQARFEWLLVTQIALLGTFLVSYLRARADGVQVTAKIGALSRVERLVIVVVILFLPAFIEVGLVVLAIGTNATALQRLWYIYRTLNNRNT